MQAVFSLFKAFPGEIKATLRRGPESLLDWSAAFFTAVATLTAVIVWTLTASPARAAYAGDGHLPPEYLALPAQYGTIIYRAHSQGSGHLFIVGISHRDAKNRMNHHNTAQVQLEIFRIGEWLHRNIDLDLLLPEGYFGGEQRRTCCKEHVGAGEIDTDLLYSRLADDAHFVNAEMLLTEQFGMHTAQMEDKPLYDAVCTCLGELTQKNCSRKQMTAKLDELEYLQEIRTAGMLQKIPSAIEAKLCAGAIRKPTAMMTIGLDHLQDIIRFLQQNTITITAPDHGADRLESYTAELDLLRKGYSITVIIPRTLAEDRPLLQATHLDQVPPLPPVILADGTPRRPQQQ